MAGKSVLGRYGPNSVFTKPRAEKMCPREKKKNKPRKVFENLTARYFFQFQYRFCLVAQKFVARRTGSVHIHSFGIFRASFFVLSFAAHSMEEIQCLVSKNWNNLGSQTASKFVYLKLFKWWMPVFFFRRIRPGFGVKQLLKREYKRWRHNKKHQNSCLSFKTVPKRNP